MEGMPSKRKTMRQTLRNSIAAAGALLWAQSDTSLMAQTLTTTQEVQKHTMSLTQKLAPGGSWDKKLHDQSLTKDDLMTLIKEEVSLADTLQKSWNEEKWQGAVNFGMFTVFNQIPGLAVHVFQKQEPPGLKENGGPAEAASCNGQFIRDISTGMTYFATQYHCIENAPAFIKAQYIFDLDSDWAIIRVPDYKGKALPITLSTTRQQLSGKIACVVGYKDGQKYEINDLESFCGIINPMTKEAYRLLMGEEPQNNYLDRSIRDGLWTVFPQSVGIRKSETDVPHMLGFSGGIVVAYDPATKSWSMVGQLSSIYRNDKDEETGAYKVPGTVSFITTPEQLQNLIKLEQLRHASDEARKVEVKKGSRTPRFGDQVIERIEKVEDVLHKVQSKTEPPWKTTVKVRKKNS